MLRATEPTDPASTLPATVTAAPPQATPTPTASMEEIATVVATFEDGDGDFRWGFWMGIFDGC